MNDEILERLLIDRAMGQLSDDVAALLSAHLASSPEAPKLAEEIEATVSLAAKVLPRARAVAPMPSPIPRLIAKDRIHRVLALAASFVVGAGFAFLELKRTMSHSERAATIATTAPRPQEVPQPHIPPEVEREAQSLPFWSNRRAILLTTAARRQPESRENP